MQSRKQRKKVFNLKKVFNVHSLASQRGVLSPLSLAISDSGLLAFPAGHSQQFWSLALLSPRVSSSPGGVADGINSSGSQEEADQLSDQCIFPVPERSHNFHTSSQL